MILSIVDMVPGRGIEVHAFGCAALGLSGHAILSSIRDRVTPKTVMAKSREPPFPNAWLKEGDVVDGNYNGMQNGTYMVGHLRDVGGLFICSSQSQKLV